MGGAIGNAGGGYADISGENTPDFGKLISSNIKEYNDNEAVRLAKKQEKEMDAAKAKAADAKTLQKLNIYDSKGGEPSINNNSTLLVDSYATQLSEMKKKYDRGEASSSDYNTFVQNGNQLISTLQGEAQNTQSLMGDFSKNASKYNPAYLKDLNLSNSASNFVGTTDDKGTLQWHVITERDENGKPIKYEDIISPSEYISKKINSIPLDYDVDSDISKWSGTIKDEISSKGVAPQGIKAAIQEKAASILSEPNALYKLASEYGYGNMTSGFDAKGKSGKPIVQEIQDKLESRLELALPKDKGLTEYQKIQAAQDNRDFNYKVNRAKIEDARGTNSKEPNDKIGRITEANNSKTEVGLTNNAFKTDIGDVGVRSLGRDKNGREYLSIMRAIKVPPVYDTDRITIKQKGYTQNKTSKVYLDNPKAAAMYLSNVEDRNGNTIKTTSRAKEIIKEELGAYTKPVDKGNSKDKTIIGKSGKKLFIPQ